MTDPTETLAALAATLERVEVVVQGIAARPAHDCAAAEVLARRMDALEARERARARRWWVLPACSLVAGAIGGLVGYLLGSGS